MNNLIVDGDKIRAMHDGYTDYGKLMFNIGDEFTAMEDEDGTLWAGNWYLHKEGIDRTAIFNVLRPAKQDTELEELRKELAVSRGVTKDLVEGYRPLVQLVSGCGRVIIGENVGSAAVRIIKQLEADKAELEKGDKYLRYALSDCSAELQTLEATVAVVKSLAKESKLPGLESYFALIQVNENLSTAKVPLAFVDGIFVSIDNDDDESPFFISNSWISCQIESSDEIQEMLSNSVPAVQVVLSCVKPSGGGS